MCQNEMPEVLLPKSYRECGWEKMSSLPFSKLLVLRILGQIYNTDHVWSFFWTIQCVHNTQQIVLEHCLNNSWQTLHAWKYMHALVSSVRYSKFISVLLQHKINPQKGTICTKQLYVKDTFYHISPSSTKSGLLQYVSFYANHTNIALIPFPRLPI